MRIVIGLLFLSAQIFAANSVKIVAGTEGGYDTHSLIGAASTNATVIKAAKGQLYCWYIYNNNDAIVHVKLYDKATTPDETDVPKLRLTIPIGGANLDLTGGIDFDTGIAYRTTDGVADGSTAAIDANEVTINFCYK